MKQLVASALMLLSPVLVMAQDAAPAPAKPAPKAAAKAAPAKDSKEAKKPAAKSTQSAKAAPAKDAKKPVHVAKAHPQSSRAQLKSATNQVASGLIAAEAALSPAELEIAQRVHTGHIPCELGASVNIEADPKSPGYFEVAGKNFHYRMTPVATSTGAVRLEDQKAGAVWIQISNKSMLMNQKLGQRLADECMSPQQVAVSETIRKNPQPSLLDAPAPAPAAAAAPVAAPAAEAPAK